MRKIAAIMTKPAVTGTRPLKNMDINVIGMLSGLALLHGLFALRAFKNQVRISPHKKYIWCLLSLLLGPMGYYAYQGLIPLDKLSKD